MKNLISLALLFFFLAACAPVVTPSPTKPSVPTAVSPSPLPTQLTLPATLDPAQAKQQEEIKSIIHAYFDLRYQALSVSPPEDFQSNGFGDLVSAGPDAKDFLVTEMAKLAVQRKWIELNRFGYAKYEYSLTYKSVVIDTPAQIATVSLLEDFTIITERAMERNPEAPSITRGDLTHEIVLHKEEGQWKIVSDVYWDAWWRSYRKPGISTDEILSKINEELQKLEAMPSATPWASPTP